MTTEIAVINRLGVALAADSAVTISGFGVAKVFDTGDKLFQLSADHPIAIMVNGNLDFLGVPWEIIIKDFRGKAHDVLPASIKDWAETFLSFVMGHRAVNAQQSAAWLRQFIAAEMRTMHESVSDAIRAVLRNSPAPSVDMDLIKTLVQREVRERSEFVAAGAEITSLIGIDQDSLRAVIAPHVAEMEGLVFGEVVPEPADSELLLDTVVRRVLTAIDEDGNTGLVVCGFGGDALFPSLFSVSIDGVVADRLRYVVTHQVEITRDLEPDGDCTKELGTALSFAQTDVIDRLLRGVDQRFVNRSKAFIDQTVSELIPSVFDHLGLIVTNADGAAADVNLLATFLGKNLASQYEPFSREIGDEIEREFKQTIALMPKQELIELAEALVGITAVERKASYDAGTVGGPIDVALITRSEGFVWVKRKHHFKADMNLRYLSRVFGWSANGTGDGA